MIDSLFRKLMNHQKKVDIHRKPSSANVSIQGGDKTPTNIRI
jgi:hypothetical protein